MRLRIAIWASASALAVVFWTFFILSATSLPAHGIAWTLVRLTCPIALARHYAFSFYFAILVNAGTYAFVGAVAEILRRRYKRSKLA